MQQQPPIASPLAKYKLVFLGDQSVGKTSIINRFIYNAFDGKDHPTVGIDFISKTLHIDDRSVRLQLWDTAGQERFRSLIPSYIRDSSVAIIVYDITNRTSFENVKRWVDDVHAQRGNDVLIIIVGNKADLEENRAVRKEDGEAKAKSFEVNFIEVSAKSGDGVNALFKMIAATLPGSETSQMMSMSGRTSMTQGPALVGLQSTATANKIQLNPTTVNQAEEKKAEQSKGSGCC